MRPADPLPLPPGDGLAATAAPNSPRAVAHPGTVQFEPVSRKVFEALFRGTLSRNVTREECALPNNPADMCLQSNRALHAPALGVDVRSNGDFMASCVRAARGEAPKPSHVRQMKVLTRRKASQRFLHVGKK